MSKKRGMDDPFASDSSGKEGLLPTDAPEEDAPDGPAKGGKKEPKKKATKKQSKASGPASGGSTKKPKAAAKASSKVIDDPFGQGAQKEGMLPTDSDPGAGLSPELAPLQQGLQQVQAQLKNLADQQASLIDRSPAIDLSELREGLDAIEQELSTHDPAPLHEKLEQIAAAIAALPEAPEIDLAPLHEKLDQIAEATSQPPEYPEVDLSPIQQKLDAIEAKIPSEPPEFPEADFSPILDKIDELAAQLPEIPEFPALDPIQEKLDQLSTRLPEPQEQDLLGSLQEMFEGLGSRESDSQELLKALKLIQAQLDDLHEQLEEGGSGTLASVSSAPASSRAALSDEDRTSIEALLEKLDSVYGELSEFRQDSEQDEAFQAILEKLEQIAEATSQPPEFPEVDLSPIQQKLDAIEAKIPAESQSSETLDITPLQEKLDQIAEATSQPPEYPEVDLSPIQQKLDAIEAKIPSEPPEFPEADFSPILDKIDELAAQLPEIPEFPEVDLGPIQEKLDQIAETAPPEFPEVDLGPIHEKLDQLAEAPEVDLDPVQEKLDQIAESITQLGSIEIPELDWSPIQEKLESFELQHDQINVDLSPIQERFDAIEARLQEENEQQIKAFLEKLDAFNESLKEEMPGAPEIDLGPLHEKLDALQEKLDEFDTGEETEDEDEAGATEGEEQILTRLDAFHELLAKLQSSVEAQQGEANLSNTSPDIAVDFGPLQEQLESLSSQLQEFKDEASTHSEAALVAIRKVEGGAVVGADGSESSKAAPTSGREFLYQADKQAHTRNLLATFGVTLFVLGFGVVVLMILGDAKPAGALMMKLEQLGLTALGAWSLHWLSQVRGQIEARLKAHEEALSIQSSSPPFPASLHLGLIALLVLWWVAMMTL